MSPRSHVAEVTTLLWDFASEWLVLVLSNSCFDGKNKCQYLYNTTTSLSSFPGTKVSVIAQVAAGKY